MTWSQGACNLRDPSARSVSSYTIRRDAEDRIKWLKAQLRDVEAWKAELATLEEALKALGGPVGPA